MEQHVHAVSQPRGAILLDVGKPLDYFYFSESGMVCSFAVMDDGRSIALAAIGREGFVGAPNFLGAESVPMRSVVAFGGVGLKLRCDELLRILPASPKFAAALRRYSFRYIAQIGALGACHALHSVQQRVATWLLIARDRSDSDFLPLTHESLSEWLGCRRSSVTESLSLLEDAGVIGCGRSQISILDPRRLAQQSCECHRSFNRRAMLG